MLPAANAQNLCGLPAPLDTNPENDLADDENISLTADSASFESNSDNISVEGNVELVQGGTRVTGDTANYNAAAGEVSITNTTYSIGDINARGEAGNIYLSAGGVAKLQGVKYTTCPEDDEVWSLTAKEIKVDIDKGYASTKNAAIRLKNVPVLYLPYASYPISDKRKTGFLIPGFRTSNQRGLEINAPFYWNIAPNYDATFTPRYMSRRGLMLGAEGRMLRENGRGAISGNYLSNDDITGTDRYIWNIDLQQEITDNWRTTVDATTVSDDRYLNDFSNRWSTASLVALDRSVALEHYDDVWSVFLRIQDYQTVNELLPEDDEPYIRLPQLAATGEWRDSFLGANYRLETEGTYFTRNDDSVEGVRVHIEPEISYELNYNGVYVIPKASLFHTSYNLQNTAQDANNTPNVTSGIYSIDSGATFERLFSNGSVITLEPRAQYVYVPFQNQDELPVFDTVLPDNNLVQLFAPNRYLRYDRVGDTNQINLGFTSRVFGAKQGREILTAAFGTARYFSDQRVTLPDETARSTNSGDYLLQARVNLSEKWNLDAGYQWSSATKSTDQGNIRVQLKPTDGTVLNAGYRYQKDSNLDQGDFSFAWAVSQRWNLLGRAVYSVEEDIFVDKFGGIEYESCCWGIRFIYRERVSRDIDRNDTSIGIQFVLKGFTELGNSVRSQLESGILGYADL